MPSAHSLTKLLRGASLALTIVFVSLVFEQPTFVSSTEAKPSKSPGRPISNRTKVGGSRGQCSEAPAPLIALVPTTVAITTSARPTFWFYSPYQGKALEAKFILQSDNENVIGDKENPLTVKLPEKPGFVRIRLRSTDADLKVGQSYHWFFKVLCNGPGEPEITVESEIQVASKQPALIPSDESDGRLFDAVAALAERRLKKPQDATLLEEWKRLLRSLKFELEEHPLTPEQVNEIATSPLN